MTDKIDSALVDAFIDGGFFASAQVAHENFTFTPTADTAWAQLFIVPNQPSVNTMGHGGRDLIDGFLQINLNYPVGSGAGAAKSKATDIREYFYAGRVFTYSGQDVFISSAGRGISRNVDGWFQTVVTINWEARVTRP